MKNIDLEERLLESGYKTAIMESEIMRTPCKITKEEYDNSPNNWQDNSAQCVKLVCSKCGSESISFENGFYVCKECGKGLYEMLKGEIELPTINIVTKRQE